MKNKVSVLLDKFNTTGRVFYHKRTEVLYLNWSGTALEFEFKGTELSVDLVAMAGIEYEGIPGDTTAPSHENWPFFALSVDGEIIERVAVEEREKTVSFDQVCDGQKHLVRIIKLTENLKTQLGIAAISFEGEITKPESKQKPRVEFIGDSITCGFGNMVSDRAPIFYTKDEDQTHAHGYLAAQELDFDYSIVSVSGICTYLYDTIPMEYGMNEIYEFTDRIIEDKLDGRKPELELEKYDFAANHNDFVVLNLGTNDGSAITFAKDPAEYLKKFYKNYRSFVDMVRRFNGPDTHIICALGTMGYYVYSDIEKIIAKYVEETSDKKISCYRYVPLNIFDGVGTGDHPSRITQEKMAREIAKEIRRIQTETERG